MRLLLRLFVIPILAAIAGLGFVTWLFMRPSPRRRAHPEE